ncbi:cullin family [Ceratobasidium sp. AG-Ba]|nr:cullin family [Ceratobasidium sp. AG-Ba]
MIRLAALKSFQAFRSLAVVEQLLSQPFPRVQPPGSNESVDASALHASRREADWRQIKKILDNCMSFPEKYKSQCNYRNAYTAVYNHLTSYTSIEQRARAKHLYQKLTTFFATYTEDSQASLSYVNERDILSGYAAEWNRYKEGARMVSRITRFLKHRLECDGTIISRDEGAEDLYWVEDIAYIPWQKNMLRSIRGGDKRPLTALLSTIESARNGERVDTKSIKAVVESLALDLGSRVPGENRIQVDERVSHAPFLLAAQEVLDQSQTMLLQSLFFFFHFKYDVFCSP